MLEGEGPEDEDDEEAKEAREEMARKYTRRQLGSNADRYKEEEPELDSEGASVLPTSTDPNVVFLIAWCCDTGEEIKEPEIDLSNFLARQRLDDAASPSIPKPATEPDEDEVDHSLAHLNSAGLHSAQRSMKGKVRTVEWDEDLENMSREKAAADANRGERKRAHGG